MTKPCSVCENEKPLEDFYRRHSKLPKASPESYRKSCKSCDIKQVKLYQATHPGRKINKAKHRRARLRYNFNRKWRHLKYIAKALGSKCADCWFELPQEAQQDVTEWAAFKAIPIDNAPALDLMASMEDIKGLLKQYAYALRCWNCVKVRVAKKGQATAYPRKQNHSPIALDRQSRKSRMNKVRDEEEDIIDLGPGWETEGL